jgi:glycosyltransferase involved in cell wall biosynthesis
MTHVSNSHGLKVLLVGHSCGPDVGSEPGFTWNWARQLSSHHQVWVLTHPVYRENVERFLAERPNPNLRFAWVSLSPWEDPWDPAKGERWIRLHYLLWQRAAFREAARLHRLHSFDLVHHVSWGTLSAPPVFWRLPIPFVWGPVGGGQIAPPAFRGYFGSAWRREQLRTARIWIAPLLPPLRRAVRRCAFLLATNRETIQVLETAGARHVRLFLDTGLSPEYLPATPPKRPVREGLIVFWAGRLEPRKALPLALEALTQVDDPAVRLEVAGDGPLRGAWEKLATRLGVEARVRFLGRVPWAEMPEIFRRADSFLFTSLRDSFGSVVFEAMAHALPILTLNHQGVGAFVPPEAGIKVPVTTPAQTVAALAQALRQLAKSPQTRHEMGEVAWTYAKSQTWDCRAAQMSQWYQECLERNL